MFLVCLAYLLVGMALPPGDWPPWLRDAKSGPYLAEAAHLLRGFLPASLQPKSADLAPATVDPAVEASRAVRALEKPADAGQAAQEPASPRYREQNRRELDRLIGSQR